MQPIRRVCKNKIKKARWFHFDQQYWPTDVIGVFFYFWGAICFLRFLFVLRRGVNLIVFAGLQYSICRWIKIKTKIVIIKCENIFFIKTRQMFIDITKCKTSIIYLCCHFVSHTLLSLSFLVHPLSLSLSPFHSCCLLSRDLTDIRWCTLLRPPVSTP